jgi:hypothetical protein
MKTKIANLFLLFTVFLTSCSGVTPVPIPNRATSNLESSTTTLVPTITNSSITQLRTFTSTPTITPTPYISSTPETLNGFPTPPSTIAFPTCDPNIKDCLTVEHNFQREDLPFHELYLGKYVLRNWCDTNQPVLRTCIVTISSKSKEQIELWGNLIYFGAETGADLTGNGKSDIVIIDYPGGNCCVETIVYEVGDSLKKIMDIKSHSEGEFIDLNSDGSHEYIAQYRNFSRFCVECTLWASVVYEYRPEMGYVPATNKFKDVLSKDIQGAQDIVTQFAKQNPGMLAYFPDGNDDSPSFEDKEFTKFYKANTNYPHFVNILYQLIAYYLLIGQPIDAQKTLNKYCPPDKVSEYYRSIQAEVGGLLAH